MATMERARDRGRHRARSVAASISQELREARLAAGASHAHVAHAADLRQSRVSRTERATDPMPRLDELSRHCAALGLRLSVRAYPAGTPVRDAAQLRLIGKFRTLLPDGLRCRTEVPVGAEGDLRAWDLVVDGPLAVAIDAETRLRDMQALQRRVELKWRDSGVPRVVLLVASTHHNRTVLREHRAAVSSTFPLDTRKTLRALRQGQAPSANGIVLL